MAKYAATTTVGSDRSRSEIEKILMRYGASSFAYGWQGSSAMIGFEADDRQIRFVLPLPSRDDPEFTKTPRGKQRIPAQAEKEYEQAVRQKWRALALAIKSKLESVESGIELFEDAFMAQIVIPGGETVGEWMRPQIDEAYRTRSLPSMLLALSDGK